ncbi:unnamed protein product (macronuclear) [Paramecium tetraurelia]|uniref:B box-type domain-containing protein n=1 Tax=Paramecium tetraurelia TaxID=5888 RepID=A0BP31_PARTE|nr:uncharacterized protein GSPATT00005047001 [Paramecium tetraurelia]CAK60298.1 unnamed protein product [Paramecium tetraurelia]|eukprot:XP_001427696.1 hypothetical protein (macronuclear) [Paramecium tetraurelia strain d4-2]
MELLCSICGQELDICVRWPRLIPNTGDTICQLCVQQIVDQTIEADKIIHLQNDLTQVVFPIQNQLQQIKQNQLKLDDFPLNQSLLRILQLQKSKNLRPINLESKMTNQTFEEWPSDETSIDSNFLDELATSVKKPQKLNLKRFRDQDDSFGSLNYSYNSGKLCQTHRRQLEVVCLQCQTMICTNCALFGSHKGHYIYSEEDIISLLEMKAQELTEMVERIHKESSSISRSKHEQDFQAQVSEMQRIAVDKLKKEFAELRDKIDQKEKIVSVYFFQTQLVSQIMIATSNNINKFSDWWNNTIHIEKECQSWIKLASSAFEQFTEQVKYWELLNLTDSLRANGLQLQQQEEVKKNQQQIRTKKDQLIGQEINVKFNWNALKLEDFCKITEGPELTTNNNNQSQQSPYLLSSFNMQQSIEETDLLNDVSATFANEAEPVNQIKRVYRSATPTNLMNTENCDPTLSPIESNRASICRKKSQVPMKLQLYMDELRKGKTDVAEFNNLEKDMLVVLGNEIKHWKVKSVKIMKSKLLDDQLLQLFKGMLFIDSFNLALSQNDNIQSVNLSQNSLTDKSIDTLFQLYQNGLIGIHLKNIIVSQNKINARNVKQKIADFKKLGLIITL